MAIVSESIVYRKLSKPRISRYMMHAAQYRDVPAQNMSANDETGDDIIDNYVTVDGWDNNSANSRW